MTAVAPQLNALQLQMVWRQLAAQVHPFSQVLCIEGNVFRRLDDTAKQYIARNFMEHVKESIVYVIDGNGPDRVYLGAPRNFVVGNDFILRPPGHHLYWIRRNPPQGLMTATVIAPPQPKHVKIPRPPNAYILYRKERHHLVKEANPGITNNEISQILGKAWNTESDDIRQKYKTMAAQVKQALLEKHPDYQYRPRRPSERRRRRRNTQEQDQSDQGQDQSGNTVVGNDTASGDNFVVTATPGSGNAP